CVAGGGIIVTSVAVPREQSERTGATVDESRKSQGYGCLDSETEQIMDEVRKQVQLAMQGRDSELQEVSQTPEPERPDQELQALNLEEFLGVKVGVLVEFQELLLVLQVLLRYLVEFPYHAVRQGNYQDIRKLLEEFLVPPAKEPLGSDRVLGTLPDDLEAEASPLDLLVQGMRQLQQVYLEKRGSPETEPIKGSQELPPLPDLLGETGVEFSDWLYVAEQTVGSLSDSAAARFEKTLKCSKEAYQKHQTATPMERLSIAPVMTSDLKEGKWNRLERRVMTMLLSAMPRTVRDDAVTHRVATVSGALFRLHVLYAPGGVAERTAVLKQLEGAQGTDNVVDTISSLRKWRRNLTRALEMSVSPPDASVLLKGVELIAGPAVRRHHDMSFRLSLARNELQLQHRPTQETVLKYYDHVMAELQQSVPVRSSARSQGAAGDTPHLRAVGGNAGTGEAGSPTASPSKAGSKQGTPCRFFMSDAGCRRGPSCKYLHDFASKEEKRARCSLRFSTSSPSRLSGEGSFQGPEADLAERDSWTQIHQYHNDSWNPELQNFMKEVNTMLQRFSRLNQLSLVDDKTLAAKVEKFEAESLEGKGGTKSWALLDSGATNPFRPANKGEEMEAMPVQVQLADGQAVLLRQNRAGTLMPYSRKQAAEKGANTVIVPLGSLVQELGCTVAWTRRGLEVKHPTYGVITTHVSGACPFIGEAKALELIGEIENRKLEQLKVAMVETQLRLHGVEAQLNYGAQLSEYRRTGSRTEGLKALMCEDSVFGCLTEAQRCALAQDIDLSDKAGHKYLKALPVKRAMRKKLMSTQWLVHVYSGEGGSKELKVFEDDCVTLLEVDLGISKAFNMREPSG
ncbi:TY2B-C, partial [Symbiodinium sp. CCMP2456]